MNCQDVAKLRTPLDAVCQTTDIGCVPIVDGKPTCVVQPDELPIAFDPKTTTLWLFSCKTREWIPFQKFMMCQLDALNLENITNICDVLNIGVNYAGSGECRQGTVTLRELSERILECLTLETKIITIGDGDGNKLKITIDGLPLDPVYVSGRNIWSEGGSGTETDPLVVATYDPICKWPVKTQAQVDAANTKHLGACVDGEMSRVPFPPKVCEFPSKNQAQVDAAGNKELIACVDGEGVKIPYPGSPCEYPQLTPEQMMGASDKDFIACVDGQNVKVPVPGNLYESSPCLAPDITLDQAKVMSDAQSLRFVACDGTNMIKVPVFSSGFFDRDYICVPEVIDAPVTAPVSGTGPLRIDCNGTLWVWLCDQGRWEKVKDGINGIPKYNEVNIPDICNDFRMKGWVVNDDDPCSQDFQFTLKQLAKLVTDCIVNDARCHRPVVDREFTNFPFIQDEDSNTGARSFELKSITLQNISSDTFSTFDRYVAIYNMRARRWEYGSNPVYDVPQEKWTPYAGKRKVVIDNELTNGCRTYYRFFNSVQLLQHGRGYGTGSSKDYQNDFSVSIIARATEDQELDWAHFSGQRGGATAPTRHFAALNWNSKTGYNQGDWNKEYFAFRVTDRAQVPQTGYVNQGETHTYYMHCFLVITSNVQNLSENNFIVGGFGSYVDLQKLRGMLI